MSARDWLAETSVAWEDDPLEVQISALEHFSYCARQCALIHIEQTYEENEFTMRGLLAHERVDRGDDADNRGIRTVRAAPLWSERLRLRGKADVIEFHGDVPYPIEYKVGRPHGKHAALQLCAQALCLEEMLGTAIPQGAIYYHATRQRKEVSLDAALRTATVSAIEGVRSLLRRQELPEAANDARCPQCSLINACLPYVVGEPARMRGLQGALFRVWDAE
jgi:CRISPR-associated exonuclease Cas4